MKNKKALIEFADPRRIAVVSSVSSSKI